MEAARKIVEAGQAERKNLGVKIRIPLANLNVKSEPMVSLNTISDQIWDVILKELNTKNITINDKFHYPKIRVNVTEEQLREEGRLRELVREIQSQRKIKGLKSDDKINLMIPKEFESKKDFIAKRVLAKEISYGDKVAVL
jgi:hypothetical protein